MDSPTSDNEIKKPGVHRRLYQWVLSLAHRKHAGTALFTLSFAESSFFPIPPDVLQMALTLERPARAWYYAFITLAGSVLGGILGYVIGYAFWGIAQDFFYAYVFSEDKFMHVVDIYARWDFWIVFIAAFTPIPYKIITITAGLASLNFPVFLIASLVGRGARFFLVAALLYAFGAPIKRMIDRYFNLLCIAFTVLLIGGLWIVGKI